MVVLMLAAVALLCLLVSQWVAERLARPRGGRPAEVRRETEVPTIPPLGD